MSERRGLDRSAGTDEVAGARSETRVRGAEGPPGNPGEPLRVEVFMDYHCPYSQRVVGWLDALDPRLVEVRYRFFALEQVNHDPEAAAWRLWEQPLDYAQYRDRPDRRALAAFLATTMIEGTEEAGVVRRFRGAVYAARFEDQADISDVGVLSAAANAAGAAPGRLPAAFADPRLLAAGRSRIAADWAAARAPWRVFGVPTLRFGDESPFYLRLAGSIPARDGPRLLRSLVDFRAAAPGIVELKEPEHAPPG
jgi:predicted DsbA family dithiol-disulfide isomerase